jgi:hypothetical protein
LILILLNSKKAIEKVFTETSDIYLGLQSAKVTSPGGKKMSVQSETAKTRKEEDSEAEAKYVL